MSDTTTAPAETAEQTQPEPEPTKPETDWKAKAREWERRAKENSKAAERLAQLEESQKTESQRLQERAERAETALAEREKQAMRLRVAVAKQLPPELVDRLQGDTEEEVSADADALLSIVTPQGPGPRPDLSQGKSSDTTALNGDPLLNDLRSKLGIR